MTLAYRAGTAIHTREKPVKKKRGTERKRDQSAAAAVRKRVRGLLSGNRSVWNVTDSQRGADSGRFTEAVSGGL